MTIAALDQDLSAEAAIAYRALRTPSYVEDILPQVFHRLPSVPAKADDGAYLIDESAIPAVDWQTIEKMAPAAERQTAADRTVSQLLQFERLQSDWDGSGAGKPIAASLKDAREFIRRLTPESTIPMATLHADGHAVLLVTGADAYAEIEFLGDKRLGYFARRDGQEWGDEVFFNGGNLPAGLPEIGFAIGD